MDSRGSWSVGGSDQTCQKALEEINNTDRAKIDADKDVLVEKSKSAREVKIEQAKLLRDAKMKKIAAERAEKLAIQKNKREVRLSEISVAKEIRLSEISAAKDLKLRQLEVCAEKDYELQGQKVEIMKEVLLDKSATGLELAKLAHAEKMAQLKNEEKILTKHGQKKLQLKNACQGVGIQYTIQESSNALGISQTQSTLAIGFQGNPGLNFQPGNTESTGAIPLDYQGHSSPLQLQYSGSTPAYDQTNPSRSASMSFDDTSSSGIGSSDSASLYQSQSSERGYPLLSGQEPLNDFDIDIDIDAGIEVEALQMTLSHDVEIKKLDNDQRKSNGEFELKKFELQIDAKKIDAGSESKRMELQKMELEIKKMEMELKLKQNS